jgi:hypothetical protein
MTKKEINIDELRTYVFAAFTGDEEIVSYYDKMQNIKSASDACENVYSKITNEYADAKLIGIEIDNEVAGYLAYKESLLISFSLGLKFRKKDYLVEFWEIIKAELPKTFQCVLYSHNSRAINYLEKSGMDVLFENVTILQFSSN